MLGILTLFAFIGLFILIAGLMAGTTVYVVTTRRFMIIEGKKVSFIPHGQVKQVTRKLGGARLRWLELSDGVTTLSWQAAANPPSMPGVLQGFLDDPDSAARAQSVALDSVAG